MSGLAGPVRGQANSAPVVSVERSYVTTRVDRPVPVRALAWDPDDDFVVFRWDSANSQGGFSSTTAEATSYTPWVVGVHQLVVTVGDGRGGVTTASLSIEAHQPAVTDGTAIQVIAGPGVEGSSGDGGAATDSPPRGPL